MINIINILFILFGVYLFYVGMISATSNISLLLERNHTCSSKFLKKQKWCDGINSIHEFSKLMLGLTILLKGINFFNPLCNTDTLQTITFLFLLFESLISQCLFNYIGLKSLMIEIEEKWEREKKVSNDHDDEVRYYKQSKNISKIVEFNTVYLLLLLISTII